MNESQSTKVDYTKFFRAKGDSTKDLFHTEKQLHPKYGEIYVQKCRMK